MKTINKRDFILKSIDNRLPLKRRWFLYVLTIPLVHNEYVNVVNGKYEVMVDGDNYVLEGCNVDKPIVDIGDTITVPKETLKILDKDIKTTITNLLVNYVILEYGLDGKFKYINNRFNPSDVWDLYVADTLGSTVSVEEYLKYTNACLYIRQFSNAVVISSTPKMITPAPGIDKFKNNKFKEYVSKYGDNVFDDPIKIAEFETEVKQYDKDYLKDDPSLNIMLSPKIQNQSRKLKYVSIGKPAALTSDTKPKFILNSLKDGIPNDPHAITSIFTGIRVGSYARGNETKDSGLDAKNLIRPTRGFVLDTEDCRTTRFLEVLVTKQNHHKFKTRYHFVNGETVPIGNQTFKLVGTTIKLRDPLFCRAEGDRFCRCCIGNTLYMNKNSILLLTISAGGKGLSQSLSKFHFKGLELTTLTKDVLFK